MAAMLSNIDENTAKKIRGTFLIIQAFQLKNNSVNRNV
jgi:hypothetical protein